MTKNQKLLALLLGVGGGAGLGAFGGHELGGNLGEFMGGLTPQEAGTDLSLKSVDSPKILSAWKSLAEKFQNQPEEIRAHELDHLRNIEHVHRSIPSTLTQGVLEGLRADIGKMLEHGEFSETVRPEAEALYKLTTTNRIPLEEMAQGKWLGERAGGVGGGIGGAGILGALTHLLTRKRK